MMPAVSRTSRYLLVIVLVLVAVVLRDIIFVRHVLPRMLIQPSPDAIADTFVKAITAGDLELALSLTDGTTDCVANMTRTFEWYSPKYTGVQADELDMKRYFWYVDDPADETIAFTFFSDLDDWPITFRTTYSPFGKRFTCGSVFADEPKAPVN